MRLYAKHHPCLKCLHNSGSRSFPISCLTSRWALKWGFFWLMGLRRVPWTCHIDPLHVSNARGRSVIMRMIE